MGCTQTVLIGNFIANQASLRKQEKPKLNNPTYHRKVLEKSEQVKLKVSRREET